MSVWLRGVAEEMEGEHPSLPPVIESLRSVLRSVPSLWHDEIDRYVLSPLVATLNLASQGNIVLSPGQYYQAIIEEIDGAAAPCEIVGVATLSSALWVDDRDQKKYMRKNIEALRRGADIRRLFVVPDNDWPRFCPVLRELLEAGASVRRATPKVLADATSLEDMVMFMDKAAGLSRAYVADHAFDDPGKIRRGRLVLNAQKRDDLLGAFQRAWEIASVVTLRDLLTTPARRETAPEPGRSMKEYALATPVVTCQEAASAKGIPLANELKSLILSTQKGFVALHLPGDAQAALRAVKDALEVREACLATPQEVRALGLSPGTVCAVKDPTWSLPHLISRRVLTLDMVSTNNGTRRGFYRFHPAILMEAESVMIGEFEGGTDARQETSERASVDNA